MIHFASKLNKQVNKFEIKEIITLKMISRYDRKCLKLEPQVTPLSTGLKYKETSKKARGGKKEKMSKHDAGQ